MYEYEDNLGVLPFLAISKVMAIVAKKAVKKPSMWAKVGKYAVKGLKVGAKIGADIISAKAGKTVIAPKTTAGAPPTIPPQEEEEGKGFKSYLPYIGLGLVGLVAVIIVIKRISK